MLLWSHLINNLLLSLINRDFNKVDTKVPQLIYFVSISQLKFKCLRLKVGWVKADTKAIQAIHDHVITHNARVSVSHLDVNTWNLHIKSVTEEDRGGYMCQINTDPMKSQVRFCCFPRLKCFEENHHRFPCWQVNNDKNKVSFRQWIFPFVFLSITFILSGSFHSAI